MSAITRTTYAAVGDVIGNIYSTDILAKFNGFPIPSYSIDGKTAIVVEDLRYYGYTVIYDDISRTLSVIANSQMIVGIETSRGQVGAIVGQIYETDIITFFNGIPVPCFAIQGRMCVSIEDLGDLNDSPNAITGLSAYLFNYNWDGFNRIIALNSAPKDYVYTPYEGTFPSNESYIYLSYQGCLDYVNNLQFFTVREKLDAPAATVIYGVQSSMHGGSVHLYVVYKTGGLLQLHQMLPRVYPAYGDPLTPHTKATPENLRLSGDGSGLLFTCETNEKTINLEFVFSSQELVEVGTTSIRNEPPFTYYDELLTQVLNQYGLTILERLEAASATVLHGIQQGSGQNLYIIY